MEVALSRRKRDREPSRIPYKRVIKLFRKTNVRSAAKAYLRKSIPDSSKLKLFLSARNRCYFSERLVRCKFVLLSNKFPLSHNVYLSVVRLRTLKHKKSPLFCMRVDERALKKLKHSRVETFCVSHRVISLSGDVEENPGPSNQRSATSTCNLAAHPSSVANSVSLLEARLSRLNRTAVDVGGDGDCFFRAVSHQLYGSPNNHSHIRSLGVQYLLQNPEQFIESNTDHSWQDYLNNMSCQGTWADAIIIQAVANCLNLLIHIVESFETFAPVTVVQPVNVTGEHTIIYIGHISETHYVSTVERRNRQVPNSETCDQSVFEKQKMDKQEKLRADRDYMKEYMKKRRANADFRKRENQNSIQRYNNIEKIREKKKQTVIKRKMTNPEHVREIDKKSKRKRKAENPDHIKEIAKRSSRRQKVKNPEQVREIDKTSFRKRKEKNPEHRNEIDKQSFRKRKAKNPEHRKEIDKRSFMKRKADNPEHIQQVNRNAKVRRTMKFKLSNCLNITCSIPANENQFENSHKSSHVSTTSNDHLLQTAKNESIVISLINLFHKNIKCGPEYICTCCDQLWYKSSAVKCNANTYKACSQDLVESCVTGIKSVENTEWICRTCDSNLRKGKLPSLSKANKMGFPKKPDLLDLTPLEERLISPRIPFMQIRELPRGGQLSIHGNIVNVPSDVNSTVHCLPRPINESQTIPIKLKRRLSYKHHYQFQNVRPKKVLDAAQYLVNTSDLFKREGIEVQNAWLDNISLQSSAHEEWSEFVENSDTWSNNDLQTQTDVPDDKMQDCQKSISDAHDEKPGCEKEDSDDWCEVDERPSGVTDTLLQEPDVVENVDNNFFCSRRRE